MSLEKRRAFIDVTYRILCEESLDGITIRRIAKELNCTSTVIYRYFDSIDHLISLASIRFLDDYIADFRSLVNNPQILTDPYGLNFRMWECLAQHAFAQIPVYENLFFGKYQNSLCELIFEYYQLFIDDMQKREFDGFSVSILFNEDIYQRNAILMRRAAAVGQLTEENANLLSQLECHVFRSILRKYLPKCKEPHVPQLAANEFLSLIQDLGQKYKKK